MTRILLVRHGHVAGIDPPRFRGRADLCLTEKGKEQAERVALRIGSEWICSAIYTSPLSRCVDTGKAIAKKTGARLTTIEALNDLDYGAWQGKTWDDAQHADASLFEAWRRSPDEVAFPSGESLHDVAARAASVLRFAREMHPDETIVMVSHDSVNRVILSLILSLPLSSYWRLVQTPCCINEIEYAPQGPRAIRINDATHVGN